MLFTGVRPFPGSRVTFLPFRPLEWGFHVFFRSSFSIGLCAIAVTATGARKNNPVADFGLAS
jgi:hypothetical protein